MFVGVSNIGKTTLLGKLKGDTNTTKGWHERKVLQKTPRTLIFYFSEKPANVRACNVKRVKRADRLLSSLTSQCPRTNLLDALLRQNLK